VIDRFRFNGPIFLGIELLGGPVAATGFAVAAGLVVAGWARRRLPLTAPQAWAWPMAATVLCAPLVYPWYLLPIAPFLVVAQTRPLTIWTISILSAYVAWQRVGVPWGMPVWALVVEYGPVLVTSLLPSRSIPPSSPQPS